MGSDHWSVTSTPHAMRQKRRPILRIVCFTSVGLCALLLLRLMGLVPPLGVGWGDGVRGRAYSVGFDGSLELRMASGMKTAPPGGYAYGVQSLARSEGLGFHYHRWNMTAGRTPQAAALGTFAEVRFAPAWPLLILLTLVSLCVMARVRERRLARRGQHCPDCGYDLRATPERCPECGRARRGGPAAA